MIKTININLYKNNKLEKSYKEIKCISNKDYIFYLDDIKTSLKNNIFIRENNEFKFTIDLDNKESYYLLKEKNLTFDIEVLKSNIIKKDKTIIIEYLISSDEEPFKIEIIER